MCEKMQAAMLAGKTAKNPVKRWATIAPNYANGKDAVAAFKKALKAKSPDVEFVAEQWPALFKSAPELESMHRPMPSLKRFITLPS